MSIKEITSVQNKLKRQPVYLVNTINGQILE